MERNTDKICLFYYKYDPPFMRVERKKKVNSCLATHKCLQEVQWWKEKAGLWRANDNFIIVPASSDEYMINVSMILILR